MDIDKFLEDFNAQQASDNNGQIGDAEVQLPSEKGPGDIFDLDDQATEENLASTPSVGQGDAPTSQNGGLTGGFELSSRVEDNTGADEQAESDGEANEPASHIAEDKEEPTQATVGQGFQEANETADVVEGEAEPVSDEQQAQEKPNLHEAGSVSVEDDAVQEEPSLLDSGEQQEDTGCRLSDQQDSVITTDEQHIEDGNTTEHQGTDAEQVTEEGSDERPANVESSEQPDAGDSSELHALDVDIGEGSSTLADNGEQQDADSEKTDSMGQQDVDRRDKEEQLPEAVQKNLPQESDGEQESGSVTTTELTEQQDSAEPIEPVTSNDKTPHDGDRMDEGDQGSSLVSAEGQAADSYHVSEMQTSSENSQEPTEIRSVEKSADTETKPETESSTPMAQVEPTGDRTESPEHTDETMTVGEEDVTVTKIQGTLKVKKEPESQLKDIATDTVNEFLGMMGMDSLNDQEKQKVTVNEKLVDQPQTSEPPAASETSEKSEDTDKEKMAKKPDKKKSDKGRAHKTCLVCKKMKKCKYNIVRNGDVKHLCDDDCFKVFRANPSTYLKNEKEAEQNQADENGRAEKAAPAAETTTPSAASAAPTQPPPAQQTATPVAVVDKCAQCGIVKKPGGKAFVMWQNTQFCDEKCLACYQTVVSGVCEGCKIVLQPGSAAKFYLRQGTEVKQFCTSKCLEDYKNRLKIRTVPSTRTLAKKFCAECKKDLMLDKNSFMAPAGPESSFLEFCTEKCLNTFEARPEQERLSMAAAVSNLQNQANTNISTPTGNAVGQCVVCKKRTIVKHRVRHAGADKNLCSQKCLEQFQVENSQVHHCEICHIRIPAVKHAMSFEGTVKRFCSPKCMVSFKMNKVRQVPCGWCGVTKSNFDMIERVEANNKVQLFCSLNCLSLYRVNQQATSPSSCTCDQCKKQKPAQYHLTMSDASVRNFCSYPCVINFQAQFNKNREKRQQQQANLVPQTPPNQQATRQSTRLSRASKAAAAQKIQAVVNDELGGESMPMISNVMSLANQPAGTPQRSPASQNVVSSPSTQNAGILANQANQTVQKQIVIQHPEPKRLRNKALLCKPITATKATTCRPHMVTTETQTDEEPKKSVFIPVPVPVYVPVPMAMYSIPTPYPLPLPVPVPVPCFVPTTKKSADGILKHIKEIQERIPADPFEAELLRMAEAVEMAEKGAAGESSDESETEVPPEEAATPVPNGHQAGQQTQGMMGEDILQAAFRLADEMSVPGVNLDAALAETGQEQEQFNTIEADSDIFTAARRGRGGTKRRGGRTSGRLKRQRLDDTAIQEQQQPQVMETPPPPPSDAHLSLKFMYGVNAWKHWVTQKNEQLERASVEHKRKMKLFKTDLLQCTADELNFSLCLFVKELRKPNGEEYNADSIYYLCLGIQQYLYENGRIDNIFSDLYYDQFTECLNEVLQRFEVRLNPEGMIVCRLEEEHLWESKQLGAHSPYVLLNTLIYFNTKYFMFRTAEDHINFSFARIMKQWRKGTTRSGSTTREALLKYIPPIDGTNKKKMREEPLGYEQVENMTNPLRCPVKLYDFYLSKCPESIKNRTDLFYLLPERSCVPDSPVWFSANPLPAEVMVKMLNRIRVVKEVQEAHLHDQPLIY